MTFLAFLVTTSLNVAIKTAEEFYQHARSKVHINKLYIYRERERERGERERILYWLKVYT